MTPKIITCNKKNLIGMNFRMSLLNNKTAPLWKAFMTRKDEIKNINDSNLYSLQEYDTEYFKSFNPAKEFTKWALIEVKDFSFIPNEMSSFILEEGLYAVFVYKGSSNDSSIFEYIFQTWLPQSNYALDQRPHFEVLGEKYKNNDPDSEEEIWIPIKMR